MQAGLLCYNTLEFLNVKEIVTMTSRKSIIVVIFCITLCGLLLGTSCGGLKNVKASIAGTVYIDGRPQAFGTVQAWRDGAMVQQQRCGQSGHFHLKDLNAGKYTVVYLNARGAPIGGETVVQVRLGRFETVDLYLTVQGL